MKLFKTIFLTLFLMLVYNGFYFTVYFTFLPSVNIKQMLALLGAGILVYKGLQGRHIHADTDIVVLFFFAGFVSLASLFATIYNNTSDNVYVTYIVSAIVWTAAAYATCQITKWVHGYVSLTLVGNYIIAQCAFQCVLAMLIDSFTPVANVVNSIFLTGHGWLETVDRLYGIGACLDTAGIRFSLALVILSYIVSHIDKMSERRYIPWYVLSFFIIVVFGNFMSRTTSVGAIVAIVYFILTSSLVTFNFDQGHAKVAGCFVLMFLVIVPGLIAWTHASPDMDEKMQFGFEGFYSLVETGHWETGSNNKLKTMYVYPDNAKTWIIGDGRMDNPNDDMNYLGPLFSEFYQNTDVGYLRFIFYFGLIGLSIFSFYMFIAALCNMRRYPHQKFLFILLLLVHFLCWLKVATDCYLIFALFLCSALSRDQAPEDDSWGNPYMKELESEDEENNADVLVMPGGAKL